MRKILLLFIALISIVNFCSAQSILESNRDNNRISVKPTYLYKISYKQLEKNRNISQEVAKYFSSIKIFSPNDSTLILQSEDMLDSTLLKKILVKDNNILRAISYSYNNQGFYNQVELHAKKNNNVYKKR